MAGIQFVELQTADMKQASAFFFRLFDWKFEAASEGGEGYAMHTGPDGKHIGMMNAVAQPMWLPYVTVKSVSDAAKQAQALGGTVLKERTEIPAGIFAVIADPTGLPIAVWEERA